MIGIHASQVESGGQKQVKPFAISAGRSLVNRLGGVLCIQLTIPDEDYRVYKFNTTGVIKPHHHHHGGGGIILFGFMTCLGWVHGANGGFITHWGVAGGGG